MKRVQFKRKFIEKEYLGLKIRIMIVDVYEIGTDDANKVVNISRHIWYQPSIDA